jgi:methionine-rich copper-binding protein CopC
MTQLSKVFSSRLATILQPTLKTSAVASLLLTACLAMPQLAHAHALLQKSDPAPNAILHPGPHAVLLLFNSRVDAAHSSVSLVHDGRSEPLAIEAKSASNVLRSAAGTLRAGHYIVRWQAVASDGHISRGEIPFDIK